MTDPSPLYVSDDARDSGVGTLIRYAAAMGWPGLPRWRGDGSYSVAGAAGRFRLGVVRVGGFEVRWAVYPWEESR